jgi:hypothetical protein
MPQRKGRAHQRSSHSAQRTTAYPYVEESRASSRAASTSSGLSPSAGASPSARPPSYRPIPASAGPGVRSFSFPLCSFVEAPEASACRAFRLEELAVGGSFELGLNPALGCLRSPPAPAPTAPALAVRPAVERPAPVRVAPLLDGRFGGAIFESNLAISGCDACLLCPGRAGLDAAPVPGAPVLVSRRRLDIWLLSADIEEAMATSLQA